MRGCRCHRFSIFEFEIGICWMMNESEILSIGHLGCSLSDKKLRKLGSILLTLTEDIEHSAEISSDLLENHQYTAADRTRLHPVMQKLIRPTDGDRAGWRLQSDSRLLWSYHDGTQGVVHAVRVTGILILEMQRNQTSMQELNYEFDAVFQAIPDLLYEIDENEVYHSVWTHDEGLLTTGKQALLGNTVQKILPKKLAENSEVEALREATKNGTSYGKTIWREISGGVRWFELSVARMAIKLIRQG